MDAVIIIKTGSKTWEVRLRDNPDTLVATFHNYTCLQFFIENIQALDSRAVMQPAA